MDLRETIAGIAPADAGAMRAAEARQATLTKPPGSLGRLEELSVRLAGMQGTARPAIRGKTIIVAAGDHGVVAQGVTAYPQEVTAQMALNFLSGGAAISVLARQAGIELVIVDAGIAAALPEHPALRTLGIGRGTADITMGPAMAREQAEACVSAGAALALEAAERGADAIGTGDMGIGNTTASSAIVSALTGRPPSETTGRGTGRNDAALAAKAAVVERALAVNRPDAGDPLDVLAKVGGFEIGGAGGRRAGRGARAAGGGPRRVHLRGGGAYRATAVPGGGRLPHRRTPSRRRPGAPHRAGGRWGCGRCWSWTCGWARARARRWRWDWWKRRRRRSLTWQPSRRRACPTGPGGEEGGAA